MSTSIRITIAVLLLSASAATAQDALGPVRDLYASAEYEEALSALGRLKAEAPAPDLEIDRYRVLCLIALGRSNEAERVIESIVVADPLYQPSPADAAPRVVTAFSTVRQRILPRLARSLYLEAKAAYDRESYADAAKSLERAVRVIDSVETQAKNELADLRVLAVGFLDLSRAAAEPAPVAPAPAPTPESAPPAVVAAPPPAPVSNTGLIALKQELPPLPFSIASLGVGEYRGTVEVQIDERGNVTSARMLQPVHVIYDPILLRAARDWKYEPPRIAGKPTTSLKRVEVVLKP
jgi:tetratricopeptide (TPR) repeat protein